jgi:hypothetical protein
MKYSDNKYLVLVDPLLRRLQREYDDALWADAADHNYHTDYDYQTAEREITRLKEAQQKGEMYDPIF